MIKIYFFSKKYLVNKKNSLIFASLNLKIIVMDFSQIDKFKNKIL